MAVDLAWLVPGQTRVICPGGLRGTVIAVSKTLRKAPVLVQLDTSLVRAFGPAQLLLVVEVKQGQGLPLP